MPPLLAVGEDVDSGPLLERDHIVDGAVLDLAQPIVVELPAGVPLARVEQVPGPEQAAHVLGSVDRHGVSLNAGLARLA